MAVGRMAGSALRRVRDGLTERKLGAPGFRVGRHPKLLGLAHMRVGKNFSAGDDLWLEAVTSYGGETFHPQLVIGDNVSFSDRVHVGCLGAVTIGSGVLVGSGVLISDHAHGIYRGPGQSGPDTVPALRPLQSSAPITIGRNVWLGDRVCVLAGATIGEGAVIGAMSMVNGDVPAGTMAVGVPARVVRCWDAERAEWVSTID
jgi:acetyltransferase-like isoleucine patch superfamily enzyme